MKLSLTISVLAGLVFIFSCTKQKEGETLPILTTKNVQSITNSTAICGGMIYYQGATAITEKGLCWAFSPTPTINDNKVACGSGDGDFNGKLTGLRFNNTYYVRAYAINESGVSYGADVAFSSLDSNARIPFTFKTIVTTLSQTSMVCTIYCSPGVTDLIEYGICWSTSPAPTISNNKIASDSLRTTFTPTITSLIKNTPYYVRAYAISPNGTVYSNELRTRTYKDVVTDIDGNQYNTIVIGAQEWLVENLRVSKYNDGTPLVADPPDIITYTVGGFVYYEHDINLAKEDGYLYNWYAVTSTKKLAPSGWHVPSEAEWNTLYDYCGGLNVQTSEKLLQTGNNRWSGSNSATNEAGFNALPAGGFLSNTFQSRNKYARFWTSNDYNGINALYTLMGTSGVSFNNNPYSCCFSIRCIKD